MIPLHLSLSGFLSYRDPVELDFTSFDLACISGANGAGKSSLLDAFTWALFGQARKRDDSLINAQSNVAEVSLTFEYEGNLYRVQRLRPRDKTPLLEFHILQPISSSDPRSEIQNPKSWKPLTERTIRDTEERIRQVLRMDYETFTNASFFLQGKADQFTQQRPGDRKRILGSLLGLEVWESYKEHAAERRKLVEADIASLDGSLREIESELAEEETRKQRLKALQGELERLKKGRQGQEKTVENIRQIMATLLEQQKLVDTLVRQKESVEGQLGDNDRRLSERSQERDSYTDLLARASQVEAQYTAWQAARLELERLEEVAGRFREHEKRREEPRLEIQAARARLEQELLTLQAQRQQVEALGSEAGNLQDALGNLKSKITEAETALSLRLQIEASLQSARQSQAEARAENIQLKPAMDELKARIDRLSEVEGAECPLCGQPLGPAERSSLVEALAAQGKEMGDRWRANLLLVRQSDERVSELEKQIDSLASVEEELRIHTQTQAQLTERLASLRAQQLAWETHSAPRLDEVSLFLEKETYAPEARLRLAEIDADLRATGYDAAAHDAARQREAEGRQSEAEMRLLEKAQANLAQLQRQIAELQQDCSRMQEDFLQKQNECQSAASALETARLQAPDLNAAELALLDLQEQENICAQDVGAAKQQVEVLGDQKKRRKRLQAEREELAHQVGQYKQLERAFGKDGVPALLIEQALPEIEAKANEFLDRLSGGNMSVRFVTQAEFKDKSREDLKETLDIQISDSAGMRDYEMYSGGEAFRVNFAIRLALSEILAQRAGARLQTLVIDEGFGSQDAQGRQRLIEAINLVRPDFAKILVITHIDELKDVFPNRIEVEKTERGSVVKVL